METGRAVNPPSQPMRFPFFPVLVATLLLFGCAPIGESPTSPSPPAREIAMGDARHAEFVPGEVLVKPHGACSESVLDVLPDYFVTLRGTVDGLGVLRLEVPVGQEMEAVRRLRESPQVEWAEPNYLRSAMAVPNDQLYRHFQWNLKKIHMEQAWDITTGSPQVVVAVLDTGVDASHPDLLGKLVDGHDFLNDSPTPADDSGHGTHKAGVIGASSNNGIGIAGVSWETRIMPIKVLNSSGIGPDSVIARGIVHAADSGARVINMSFGSSTTSQVLASAVRYAFEKGALLVAAAGNTAKLDNAKIYPAAFEQVMAVAATDESDEVPSFSQRHPYLDVSAPGVRIVSCFWRGAGYGSYVSSSGTSDAAPHVSGLAALIWSVRPELTNVQVRAMIEDTADDLGPPGRDEEYGAGRINAQRALLAAKPPAAPTATPTATVVTSTPVLPAPATPVPATPVPSPDATPAPLPRTVWYFAEGSTASPFHLWLLLQNPNTETAVARVTYIKGDGTRQGQEVLLPPSSRRSIFVNQVVPDAEVSMKVESDLLVLAERAMYFGHDGHVSSGVAAPSTTWFLAEGNTGGGFDTWILLQNPSEITANAKLTFIGSDGPLSEISVGVPPTSRRSIYVNQLVPSTEVSTVVSSDQPIVAERAMYFRQGGGHGSAGSSRLARDWYVAEGRVADGFDTWLLVVNPNQAVANLKVTFMGEEGSPSVGYYAVRPNSRLSLYLNQVGPGRVGARVESDQPVLVERSTYFADGRGGHNTIASPLVAREWYLPEGSTNPPFKQEVAVLNPGQQVAKLVVTFMKAEGGGETRAFAVQPATRLTLDVNQLLPNSEVSIKVSADVPIAVERSMYFREGMGGTSSLGVPQ